MTMFFLSVLFLGLEQAQHARKQRIIVPAGRSQPGLPFVRIIDLKRGQEEVLLAGGSVRL